MTYRKPSDFNSKSVPADFQTAVAAAGFGKFNILLLLTIIPGAWTIQFESTIMAFIIPAAACDLSLTQSQKGLLNSMAFLGMVTSGFIWGFLLDTLGRRKVLFSGFIMESLIVLGKSLSQEFYLLSIFKFFGGAMTGGIYVAINTYLLEFHSTEHRGMVQMIFAMMFCSANIVIPLLSSVVLPVQIHVQLLFLDFYAWNFLIIITSITSIISAISFYFLPETPKFLMSVGKNTAALDILKKVYKLNTGKPAEFYPIDTLIEEISDKEDSAANKKSWTTYIKAGLQQIAPLFGKEYGPKLLLVCTVQSTFQMALNTIRLYMPQIFQAAHEYNVANNETYSSICDILDLLRLPTHNEEYICSVNLDNNFNVYLNSVIIAIVALVGYGITGTLVNIFGKKRLLNILGITASIAIGCMYFSKNTMTTISLSSLYLAAAGICFDLFITVIVVIFPTTLRAMAFSTCLLFGRSLTVLGNMIFPMLVNIGCAPPFFAIGGLILMAVLVACIIPNTDKDDMK